MKRVLLLAALAIIFASLLSKNVYARQGCCSHHGGVCGCGCCDGSSLSSTCAPYYPACSQPRYIAPVITRTPTIYKPLPTPTRIPTPTPTPVIIPVVKSASTKDIPPVSSIVETTTNSNSLGGLIALSIIGIISYFGLKFLGRKVSSSK